MDDDLEEIKSELTRIRSDIRTLGEGNDVDYHFIKDIQERLRSLEEEIDTNSDRIENVQERTSSLEDELNSPGARIDWIGLEIDYPNGHKGVITIGSMVIIVFLIFLTALVVSGDPIIKFVGEVFNSSSF